MRPALPGRFHPLKDLELERYLTEDLGPEDVARVEAQAARSPELRAYLAERRAEQAAFRVRQPPLRLPEARAPLLAAFRTKWAVAFAGLGVAVAAGVAWLLLAPAAVRGPHEAPLRVAARGGASSPVSVQVAVQRGESAFEYREGVLLSQGDRVRLTVGTAAEGFLTVVGRDTQGTPVVLHDNVPLQPGSTTLPGSLELDASLGPEELFLFFAAQPQPAERRLEAVRAGSVGAEATVLRLAKEPLP